MAVEVSWRYPYGAWTPEKAQLFSSALSLTMARDSMDPMLIAIAEWWRDRARRAFLASFYAPSVRVVTDQIAAERTRTLGAKGDVS